MTDARFSIGIDLGTTNSAMAFVPMDENAASEVFPVPQWISLSAIAAQPTLPSFLYLPEAAAALHLRGRTTGTDAWIAGSLARTRAAEVPGRIAHSAKSWLSHHGADREAPFLPWGSEDVAAADKISPVRASALILNYLRGVWDDRFAASGPGFAFDAQEITVGVPASFDAAAQWLTLRAAEEAGYPATLRLLEEPQAAFYNWLEEHDYETDLRSRLAQPAAASHHVLVVDVGGGTSDFSLFEVRPSRGAPPKISRIAVSDHILLGGDNMDLALAHLLEARMGGKDGKLWAELVARCRDIKERALSGQGPADEAFQVAVAGRGSSLVAAAQSAQVTRAEIEGVLLDGFFPACAADAPVRRAHTALKEWGLPYATDSRVTHHLAEFLRRRPPIDAVLFNGGVLYPEFLRDRICRAIGEWQAGPPPLALANREPDLAVARGAARFGRLVRQRQERIEAGAARAVFLETHGKPSADGTVSPALLCILPRGAATEETFAITDRGFELRINRPVRFQIYSSTRHGKTKAGELIPFGDAGLKALPPLQTIARLEGTRDGEPRRTLPVTLAAKLTELGLLQVSCESADLAVPGSWPLDFDLRPHEQGEAAGPAAVASSLPAEANATPQALEAARQRLRALFAQPAEPRRKLTAAAVLQALEKVLGTAKGDWNWVLVRALWSALEASSGQRKQSVEHEEAWLAVAGFLLRPGFGAATDEARIDSLWRVREGGFCFAGKRIKLQEYILWRRLAGGLSRERQEAVLAGEIEKLRGPKPPPPELILLAGALERLGHETKAELIERFIGAAADLARKGGHAAPYLAAAGLLLNRAPLYAGPEAVVPPALVETAYDALSGLDWRASQLTELHTLFLRAARVVDNRSLDVPSSLRQRIAGKLEKAGVAPLRTAKLRAFMPISASERLGLFGEPLPAGLILGDG